MVCLTSAILLLIVVVVEGSGSGSGSEAPVVTDAPGATDAPATTIPEEDKNKPNPTYCNSDYYCQKNFPGSICVSSFVVKEDLSQVVKKCVMNTPKVKACRGAQSGGCPAYQNTTRSYVSSECVFESQADSPISEVFKVKICNPKKDTLSDPDCWLTFGGVTGHFICSHTSECEKFNTFHKTCGHKQCQTNAKHQRNCNNHGTCTTSLLKGLKVERKCLCYTGYKGKLCEEVDSQKCDIDCGDHGKCVNGNCQCLKPKVRDVKSRCEKLFAGATDGSKSNPAGEAECAKKNCGRNGTCDISDGKCKCTLCKGNSCLLCTNDSCSNCPKTKTGGIGADYAHSLQIMTFVTSLGIIRYFV